MSKDKVLRRFAVFGGEDFYYATGGFHDFLGSYDTIDEATAFVNQQRFYGARDCFDATLSWWHIFDMDERKIVARSEYQAYGAANDNPTLDEQ